MSDQDIPQAGTMPQQPAPLAELSRDDVRFFYKVVVDDIKNAEDVQWKAAATAAAIFGALVATTRLSPVSGSALPVAWAVGSLLVAGIVAGMACWILVEQKKRLRRYRTRLNNLKKGYPKETLELLLLNVDLDEKNKQSDRRTVVLMVFVLAGFCCFAGAVISLLC